MKKWAIRIILLLVLVIFLYIGGRIFQDSTRGIVDVEKIKGISINQEESSSIPSDNLVLEGTIDAGNFEKISSISALKKEGVIYVYINTVKGISLSNKFSQSLDNVLVNYDSTEVKEIVLISGPEIIVKNTGEGNVDSIEVDNFTKKKLIKDFTKQ
ncbi:hypothetical protein ACQKDB_15695 [Planococcus kocurii]|uniref:hypothetical protein n=1 Tax=Planococcus kocurii TaxID=1374 RepID=UPI003D06F1AB